MSTSTTMATSVAPPTADVFYLTFNAGKALINVDVFARGLQHAFGQNGASKSLPDLVVFSIQEMAPLAKAFIGSYVLDPYFQQFEVAVNTAAQKFFTTSPNERTRASGDQQPFSLVATRNVGMTGIMLFARKPPRIRKLVAGEVGFGAGDMANKGAVGLRMQYGKKDATGTIRTTELTFVSTHLTHTEWAFEKRNKNWETIVSGLTFEDPKKYTKPRSSPASPRGSEDSAEAQSLLESDYVQQALHDLSIYKPGSHLFVAGDLNYRISKTAPPADAVFPSLDPESPDYYPRFLPRDQLMAEMKKGATLQGLTEAPINFPPTYKLKVLSREENANGVKAVVETSENDKVVKWKWASHRWPSWCDRVLYMDLPASCKAASMDPALEIKVQAYDAMPAMTTSDHRPVFLRLSIPVLEVDLLKPMPRVPAAGDADDAGDAEEGATDDDNDDVDARHPLRRLPFPVDFTTWEHRAAVKKWEYMIGWSMLISQSKETIGTVAVMVMVGLGAWWYGAFAADGSPRA